MNITMEQSSAYKRFLRTLPLAIRIYTGFITDVVRINTKVGSVTSEPAQSSSSSRRVLSFNDSSVLLNK